MAKQIICPTQLIHPDAKAPFRSSAKAAGHDICCVAGVRGIERSHWDDQQRAVWAYMGELGYVDLDPEQGFMFRTGFKQAIAPDHVCVFWDRSSMGGKKMVHRMAGVIDEDYRGEWFVRLVNHSDKVVRIHVGDKIVQGIYQERIEASCPIVESLEDTERGEGGFGSTDQGAAFFLDEDVVTAAGDVFTSSDALGSEGADPALEDGGPTREDLNPALAPVEVATQDVIEEAVPQVFQGLDEKNWSETPDAPEGFTYGPTTIYDGNSAGNALSCIRDRQYAAAIDWIGRDREFYPNGAPDVVPETLRTVPGRIAVAYNTLVPVTEDDS